MRKILYIILFIFIGITASFAQYSKKGVVTYDVKIAHIGDYTDVSFKAYIGKRAVKKSNTLVMSPVLTDGEHDMTLPPVVVQQGRGKIAGERNYWQSGIPNIPYAFVDNAVYARRGSFVEYAYTIPKKDWMENADLILEAMDMGCCMAPESSNVVLARQERKKPEPVPVVIIPEPEPVPPQPTTAEKLAQVFPFIVPDTVLRGRKYGEFRNEDRENALSLYFNQGSSKLDPWMNGNNRVLADLVASIKAIMNSNDSKIYAIIIAGFASPEGSLELNERLAWNRALAVKDYIMNNTYVRGDMIQLYNGGEDWDGLRMIVERSDMMEKDIVMDIIDGQYGYTRPGSKNRLDALKRLNGGRTYRYMYDNYFPKLRNAAYIKVYYDNK